MINTITRRSPMTISRVNEIDLLRFIAALLVVFYHLSFRGYAADDMTVMPYPLLANFSKYGYLGVNLFFMISGFVILMTASSGSLQKFIVSRFARLYPAFWACCTITFAMIVTMGEPRYSASLSQYLINMTMLSGFVDVPSIDGAYWSLFVEIKFYALVSMVLIIGRIHHAQLLLVLWLIASVALEILPTGKLLRYFLIVDWSAYFIAGATYFLIWSQGITLKRVGIVTLSWGLAVFQAINMLQNFEKYYSTNMSGFVVAGFVTAFFFVMYLVATKQTCFVGRNRWMLAGALTYPLYLLHQNIGFIIFNFAFPSINPHFIFWNTIFGLLGVAYIVHIQVEKKLSLPIKNGMNILIDAIKRLVMPSRAEVRR